MTSTTRATRSRWLRRRACGCSMVAPTAVSPPASCARPRTRTGCSPIWARWSTAPPRCGSARRRRPVAATPRRHHRRRRRCPTAPRAARTPGSSPNFTRARLRRTVGFGRVLACASDSPTAPAAPIAGAALQVLTREAARGIRVAARTRAHHGRRRACAAAPPRRHVAPGAPGVSGPRRRQPAGGSSAGPARRARRRHAQDPPAPRQGRQHDPARRPPARPPGHAPRQARDLPGPRAGRWRDFRSARTRQRRTVRRAISLLHGRPRHLPDPCGRTRRRLLSVRDRTLTGRPRPRRLSDVGRPHTARSSLRVVKATQREPRHRRFSQGDSQ